MSKIKKDDRIEDKVKDQYRVKNWSAYNKALENRGNITLYFDEEAIENWYSLSTGKRGGQEVYSDTCIEAIMMLKTVFKNGYRQVAGLTKSLLKLMNLSDLKVPSYTQINRRVRTLSITPYKIPPSGNLTIAIDSTGVKVYGEGEWKCRKHGWSKRRTWRKLHLGVDPDTGFIHCHTTTTNSQSDESQVDDLLDQIEESVKEVYLDGAYDAQSCYDNLIEREITPVIPPQKGAVEWYWEQPDDCPDYPRNKAVRRINEIGRAEWKKEIGYHRRSLSETAMFRYKVTFGASHYSRKIENQKRENELKIKVLNIMTAQGMPDSEIKKVA